MAINRDSIVNRIVNQLPEMGIQTKIDGEDSHTVKLVRAIVDEIINEIINNGEIIVIEANGFGIGNMGSPLTTKLSKPGKGRVR